MNQITANFLVESVNIALYVIGGIAALVIIYFILDRLVFVGRKNRKQVDELRKKYEYIHSLLIGQDSAYIKRLEIVSGVNLLVRPIYDEFNQQYEALRDNDDRQARLAVEKLEQVVGTKNHKLFKEQYVNQRVIVVNFETEVNALNKALEKVIQPETEARQAAVSEKEQYRKIRATHQLHRSELEPIDQVFQKIFNFVDSTFAEYDQAVETANYDDAQSMLDKISKTLASLDKILDIAPDLCVRTYNLIPQKINELEKTFQTLSDEQYPLHHLMVRSFVESARATLKDVNLKLSKLELSGLNDRLVAITERIEVLFTSFAKEKEYRIIFEAEFDRSYNEVKDLERKFIRLANTMPQIKTVYAIPQENEHQIEEIKEKIDYVSSLKRTLDTFIHSATRQPYSVLVDKLRHLQTVAHEAQTQMNAFISYLEQLKVGVEESFTLINETYFKLKNVEAQLRDLQVPNYASKHKLVFDQCYSQMEQINDLVHYQPIDVVEVASITAQLRERSTNLLSDLESELHLATLAENAIVYANNYRYNFSDIKNTLEQDEALFFQGEFEKAYIDAGNVLKKYSNE